MTDWRETGERRGVVVRGVGAPRGGAELVGGRLCGGAGVRGRGGGVGLPHGVRRPGSGDGDVRVAAKLFYLA